MVTKEKGKTPRAAMPRPGLDDRHRDASGEISRKHGNIRVGTLRKIYGDSFARGFKSGDRVSDILRGSADAEEEGASHDGSSFESFLDEEGIKNEVYAVAVKRILAWKIEQKMDALRIKKVEMAQKMNTSRSQLDRLLDPDNITVQLDTIVKAAQVLGSELRIELD